MIPELNGVAAVLFDEFHERSLDADLGLALARDAQTGLRDDLRILVMSATLDGARVAKVLGRRRSSKAKAALFPLRRAISAEKADAPVERQMADAIATALRADPALCWPFCRGLRKFAARKTFLAERIHDASIEIVPLFGALDAAVQDRATAPSPKGLARPCWRPRSRRHRLPSKACGSWSISAWRGCRATNRISD